MQLSPPIRLALLAWFGSEVTLGTCTVKPSTLAKKSCFATRSQRNQRLKKLSSPIPEKIMETITDLFPKFWSPKTENLVMYGILFAFIVYVWWVEHKDIHCPTLTATKAECDSQGGMPFSHTRPEPDDSSQVLLDKLYKASGAEQSSIKWRKSLTLSTAIVLGLFLLVITPGTLPRWPTMYLSILVGFVILMGSYIYYSYHVFGVAEEWMRQSIDQLRSKCT